MTEALEFFARVKSTGKQAECVSSVDFRIALDESLENVLRHGNNCDASKRIVVAMQTYKRKVVITITCSSKGFRAEDMAAPKPAENRCNPHERRVCVEAAVCRAVTSPPAPLPQERGVLG